MLLVVTGYRESHFVFRMAEFFRKEWVKQGVLWSTRKIWGQMCLLRGDLEMAGQRMPFGSVLGVFFLRRKDCCDRRNLIPTMIFL